MLSTTSCANFMLIITSKPRLILLKILFISFLNSTHVFSPPSILSQIIEDLSTSNADEIEGRFIKFDITCGSENSVNGSVEVLDQSSCVVFKVTGNLTRKFQFHCLTLSQRRKTSVILLGLTTDDFTCQRGSSRLERVNRG